MRIYFDVYNPRSASARRLARAIGARRIRHTRSRYRPRPTDMIVNWGKGVGPSTIGQRIINPYELVSIAQNKLLTFNVLKEKGLPVPDYTTDLEVAKEWVAKGRRIVSRSLLRASGGRGMVVGNEALETIEGVRVKLWVHYRPKDREWRVHVVNGQVIDVQLKRRRNNVPEVDSQVRNLDNGWVFTRENTSSKPEYELVKQQAVLAVEALGLDFGAVDLLWHERKQLVHILECNTAPGIINSTVTNYGNAFRTHYINPTPIP